MPSPSLPLRVLFSNAPDPHVTRFKHDYFAWAVQDADKRTLTIYGHALKDLKAAPQAYSTSGRLKTRQYMVQRPGHDIVTYYIWADQDRTHSPALITTAPPELPGLGR